MKFVGKILGIVFAFLGVYTLLLASEAESAQRVEEIASFSAVFFLPAVLCYVLGVTNKEEAQNNK